MTVSIPRALASVVLGAAVAQAQLWDEVIQTTYGPVQGYKYFNESTLETYFGISESNVTAYLDIPPRTAFGPACPTGDTSYISEDCLSLNIWTNAGTADAKLPVIVWNQGSDETSDNPWYYGGGMALKDLNTEGLRTTGYNTSGNYGVLDQLEVLKWVQKNIANFGGDPDRVIVAGQSFGSSQMYHAVNSPLFTGYFHGGISESGIRYPYDPLLAGLATSYANMSTAIYFGESSVASHNVSTIAELRTLSMEDLLVGSQDRPVLDGYVLPEKYIDTLRIGPANDVPVITGNTKDESGAATSTDYTVAQYKNYTSLKYGDLYDRYIRLYPDTNGTQDESWNAAARDASLVGSWAYATEWYKAASSSFYTYYWTHAPPGQDQGAFHQSEIMYALNALYANADRYPFNATDYAIQEKMSAYWANFAKTLNPNLGGSYTAGSLPYWSPNSANGTQVVMELGNAFENVPIAHPAQVSLLMEWFHRQIPY
ncbi:alpha/beta-hydrolase [Aspergillus aculeatinus CBS 121060]|uniref:Alpha/beta-hydrolase n=1 Tax=Aspergillus aculeatinus CBS 121060 TaxID=1448322 RepID=A0ACD1H1Q4_9EURO|nr:alpha/beta-hydrolase [Aspergillus aculeatinus CBS 121060]RAH67355.1 alpha/beta-hydrolase [Aspergillus aculeatinus CBS 121060]